ncbi:hypothetical protein Pelo_11079 [Pelomyxa schiedti]|nr:hypothetical protein Pelo_11079 [Pelomyxa schiedti]
MLFSTFTIKHTTKQTKKAGLVMGQVVTAFTSTAINATCSHHFSATSTDDPAEPTPPAVVADIPWPTMHFDPRSPLPPTPEERSTAKRARGRSPGLSWKRRRDLSASRDAAIKYIIEGSSEAAWAAPNPNSMASYLEPKLVPSGGWGPAARLLMGQYQDSWCAPSRGVDTYGEVDMSEINLPEEELPAVMPGDVDLVKATVLEEVMRGFCMQRPAVNQDYGGWYSFFGEPECKRPKTDGLPPYNETQIQFVENRIKWYRQRKCALWAKNLMATGCEAMLLTTACKRAWADWYPKEACDALYETVAWKLISRSCQVSGQRLLSFICGAHPRAGNKSPISLLSSHLLSHILHIMLHFNWRDECDDLEREPAQTDFEKQLQSRLQLWVDSPDTVYMGAFGNFNPHDRQADMRFYALIAAYSLVWYSGPWISTAQFIAAVEDGNEANLQCYAFFRCGAYAHTPQERFMAIRLHSTLFGEISESEEQSFRKCFTGEGTVSMADGSNKLVANVRVGDYVKTESGTRKVYYVEKKSVNDTIPMCEVSGVWLTPGHPVFVGGIWTHPFEVSPVVERFVTDLFNFELAGGPLASDHSLWINNLLVCTLGKDCGERIVKGWPKADNLAGTGYWRYGNSKWVQHQVRRMADNRHCPGSG